MLVQIACPPGGFEQAGAGFERPARALFQDGHRDVAARAAFGIRYNIAVVNANHDIGLFGWFFGFFGLIACQADGAYEQGGNQNSEELSSDRIHMPVSIGNPSR